MTEKLSSNDKQRIDFERYVRLLGKALLAWSLVGFIMFAEDIARMLYWRDAHPFREGLYWLVRCLMSALLTPFIIWAVRQWPIETTKWPRRVALHLLGSIAFGLIRTGMESALILPMHEREVLGPRPAWAQTALGVFTVLMLYSLVSGVIAYWAIVSIEATKRYYRKFQQRAREARQLKLHAAELQSQIVQAQLNALKMQLQPHFLFNTLNAIVALVRQKELEQAEEALTLFSDLLRAVLVDIEAQEVPLYRELAYLQLYLSIEQMRFPDRLRIVVDVDSSILDAAVPHMGLQPLVENAVCHCASRSQGGTITIRACLAAERLRVVVRDEDLNFSRLAVDSQRHLGIENVRARLQQLYSGLAQLVLENDRWGTSVMMVLPYKPHPDAEEQTALVGRFANEARINS